ncbi:MAG: hypothetical protein KF861_15435, partial [Planctomycetaceae bacterium]|nr:hypothetical protein [Planctomycetaceae bacterium]
LNVAFSVFAARRIFGHFLRGTQPTFLACYLLLAFAGAIVPNLPATLSWLTALGLWCLFAAGTMKVNRHVFWLVEEHRLPRICGYFPVLLLGGMFLTLFGASLASQMPQAWIGFGLVLTAVPVLLAADALAHVVQQRNPATSPSWPWSIVLPMFCGLAMTTAGVCLSGIGFPHSPMLPPTTLLAAAILAVVAHRTQNAAFVWLMLFALLMAYQTSPVLFQEIAHRAVRQGAAAVHEPKLPIAFYGLTYLPLLALLSGLSTMLRRRDQGLFSAPFRQLSVGAAVALLLVSLTSAKAVFPVGLALTGLFAAQLVMFRDRRLLLPGIAAFVLAGAGIQTFVEQVLLFPATAELPLLAWAMTGGLLLWPGRMIDRSTRRTENGLAWWQTAPICQWASLGVLGVTAVGWLVQSAIDSDTTATATGLLCGGFLLVHAWQFRDRWVARFAIGNLAILPVVFTLQAGWSLTAIIGLESLLLFGLWIVGRAYQNTLTLTPDAGDPLPAHPQTPHRILRRASGDVALFGLGSLTLLLTLPAMASTVLRGDEFSGWIAAVVGLIWTIDAARLRKSEILTVVGWLLSLGSLCVGASVAWGWESSAPWFPSLAALLSLLTIGGLRRQDVTGELTGRVVRSLAVCAVVTTSVVTILSLISLTMPVRIGGLLAWAALLLAASRWRLPSLRTAALSAASWQSVISVLQLTTSGLHSLADLSLPIASLTALPVAVAGTLLSVLWNGEWIRRHTIAEWRRGHVLAFRCVAAAGLVNALFLHARGLSTWEAILAATVFLVVAIDQLRTARQVSAKRSGDERSPIRRRDEGERYVWIAEGIVASGVAYFLFMGVLTLGGTASLYAPLVLATALWCVGRIATSSAAWHVVSRPFLQTAYILPLLTVVAGTFRHATMVAPEWLGMNSLALLMAAGFYFWRGLEHRAPRLLIGAAAIVNVALLLLWRELAFSDPQFYMIPLGLSLLVLVELLKPQIDARYLDPLRYIGALTILVSPTFHIVEGSWPHLLALMVVSVLITLAAIGLRVRALMYAGTAFLAADLVAMVVRCGMHDANLLWIAGLLVGGGVITLAAYCERHRELIVQRLRMIAGELEHWE